MVPGLAAVSRWGAIALFAFFFLVILFRLLMGRIRLAGLLSGDRPGGETYLSFGRVQLLIVSLFAAGQYVLLVYQNSTRLPEVSGTTVVLFGASAAIYIGEKAWMAFSDTGSSARRNV